MNLEMIIQNVKTMGIKLPHSHSERVNGFLHWEHHFRDINWERERDVSSNPRPNIFWKSIFLDNIKNKNSTKSTFWKIHILREKKYIYFYYKNHFLKLSSLTTTTTITYNLIILYFKNNYFLRKNIFFF